MISKSYANWRGDFRFLTGRSGVAETLPNAPYTWEMCESIIDFTLRTYKPSVPEVGKPVILAVFPGRSIKRILYYHL